MSQSELELEVLKSAQIQKRLFCEVGNRMPTGKKEFGFKAYTWQPEVKLRHYQTMVYNLLHVTAASKVDVM